MVDAIVKAASGMDADLLALADEFDIDLEGADDLEIGKKKYTNFFRMGADSRTMSPKWHTSGDFTWCVPGNREFNDFCFNDFLNVKQLGGIIVHSEFHSAQTDWVDNKGKTYCSTLGYVDPKSGELLRKLPDMQVYAGAPFKSLYEWDQANKTIDREKPLPIVEALGLVGSKGMSCADCIRSGQSTYQKADLKEGDCPVSGQMIMYVTHLTRYQMVPPKGGKGEPTNQAVTKTVKELFEAAGVEGIEGVLVSMGLPSSLGLRGLWDSDKNESLADGYYRYQMGLRFNYKGADRWPLFHYTNVSLRNVQGGKDYSLHFETDDTHFNKELLKEALTAWQKIKPSEDIEVMDKRQFNMHEGATRVVNSVPNNVVQLRSAAVQDVEVIEDAPF